MSLINPLPLLIPVKGLNVRDPVQLLDENFSPYLENWDPEPQYLKQRFPWKVFCKPESGKLVTGLGVYGAPGTAYKLFAYVQSTAANKIYDITSGTASLGYTAPDKVGDEAEAFNFSGRLGFMIEASGASTEAAVYDGSSWAAMGFTYSGNPIYGRIGTSFKGRVYFFSGTYLYYSTLSAVTGACTRLNLQEIMDSSSTLAWAGRLTSPDRDAAQEYLAFGDSAGGVYVYAGDSPESSTWHIIGRFRTAPPLGYNSILEFANDIWISTQTGVISLRALFTNANKSIDEISPSVNVNPRWGKLAKQYATFWSYPLRSVYWPEQNKIYCNMPGYLSESEAYTAAYNTVWVHNVTSGGWIPQTTGAFDSGNCRAMVYFNDNIYIATSDTVMCIDKTNSNGWQDRVYTDSANVSYNLPLLSAPFDLGKMGVIKGFEPSISCDWTSWPAGDFGMKAVGDYGVSVSGLTKISAPVGYSRPFFNCGAAGRSFQYRMEGYPGSGGTEGLKLFSMRGLA